ncbi:MAG: hypothetical protein L0Z62_13015 [Gemmataceae bacterium]|nr:hypothetical protein [Gemmataceae bacterium]
MLLLLLAVVVLLPLASAAADPAGKADPLLMRRMLVPPGRIAAELERVRQGILLKLPRQEFEDLVEKAARAGEQAANPPRLVKSTYTARLVSGALVGSGDWTIVNPGVNSAVLALSELNLGLRKVTSDDPAGGAVFGELDGKTLGLLVPHAGKQSLFFDWSLRGSGSAGPGGGDLTFELHVPPSPVAALELTLPADHTASTSRGGGLISGPHDAGDASVRLWRLQFAGRSRVDLTVRRAEPAGKVPPLVLAQLQSTQQLTPQDVTARYDFQVEVLQGSVRELTFDYDPGLQPYDVIVSRADLTGWHVEKGRLLKVKLREPYPGPGPPLRVSLLCLASLPKERMRPWASPGLRLRGATQREALSLQVHPDVQLENFRPGNFRLTRTGTATGGGQLLTLADGGNPGARPSALVRTQGSDFLVRQATWWQVGPTGSTLTSELTYEVARGTLFRLPVRVPADWELESVRLEPKELEGPWVSVPGKGSLLVLTEPQRPLAAGSKVKLTVRLRSPQGKGALPYLSSLPAGTAASTQGLTLNFPDVEPVDAPLREGVFAVSVAPVYQGAVLQSSNPTAVAQLTGLWGTTAPDYTYLFRGRPVGGRLRVTPRPPHFRARATSEVLLAAGRGSLSVRLEIEPVVGTLEAVDLGLSAPVGGPWQWTAENTPGLVRGLERLPGLEGAPRLLALGARTGLGAIATLAAAPASEPWRLTFTRPLARREVITLQAPLTQPWNFAGGQPLPQQRWEIPLLTVPGADRLEGEVSLHLLGSELLDTRAVAVRETTGPARAASAARQESWHAFRYGAPWFSRQLPTLEARTRTLRGVSPGPREVCDRCVLTSSVEPQGRLLHHFRFRVWNWGEKRTLPVYLPAGVRLLAARAEGRWLQRVEQQEGPEGVRVELPVPAGPEPHHFEVVYSTQAEWSWWHPWAELSGSAPRLPVPPTSFRRTWRLPPGMWPLGEAARRLPDAVDADDRQPWWEPTRQAWQAGRAWLGTVGPEFAPDAWVSAQRGALAAAEASLRRQPPPGGKWALGPTLERLVSEHLGQTHLVIDALALREAGADPGSIFSPGPSGASGTPTLFDRLDLAYLPCRPAPLLTTRAQLEAWKAASGRARPESGALEQAVAEAALHGRDESGRFQAVGYWLEAAARGEGPAASEDRADPVFTHPSPLAAGPYTEWELAAGASDGTLLVVRQGGVRTLGLTLAGLFCLLTLRARKGLSGRWRFRLLALWLVITGLALFWLPHALRPAAWWPALAGCAVALLWYLCAALSLPARGQGRRSSTTERVVARAAEPARRQGSLRGSASTTGAVALLLFIGSGSPTPAQPAGPEPYPVLILAEPEQPAERQSVLVPPELLKKLDELTRRGQPPRSAVLLSATYRGKVGEERAEFTADFEVYCPQEEVTVALPLAGVELKDGALWAGARAYPVAGPQGGYSVTVRRRGAQPVNTLRLVFSARLQGGSDARELRFTIPRVAQSRLVLDVPPSATPPQLVTGLGAQSVRTQAGGMRLEADLGRETALLVRWRSGAQPPRPPSLTVRETYLWDLRPAFGSLSAVLQYTVTAGTATQFNVGLPEGLEVRSVDVGQVGAPPGGAPPARLKSWRPLGKGGARQLRVQLHAPAAGEILITLGLVTRVSAAPGVHRLPVPTPLGAKSLGGSLACTVEGLDTSARAPDLAMLEIEPDTFAQAWQRLGLREPVRPTRAYSFSFRRKQGQVWLELTLQPPRIQTRQEVAWRVHPLHADFRADVALTTTKDGLLWVEWEVPESVTVSRVVGLKGTRLRFWTRSGSRLQAWLDGPAPGQPASLPQAGSLTESELRVEGWVHHGKPAADGGLRFVLPCVRLLAGSPAPNLVRVSAAPELTPDSRRPPRLDQLQPLPPQGNGTGLSYAAAEPDYRGEFWFRPSPVAPNVRTLTVAEVRDGTLTVTGHVEYQVPHGELRAAAVRLRGWQGESVQLEAPGAVQVREQRGPRGERTWRLTLPPGVTRQFAVRLTGTLPLKGNAPLALPDLSAPGALTQRRWVAVLGQGARAEGVAGLSAVKEKAETAELADWTRVAREGAVWKVAHEGWALRVVPGPTGGAPPVHVLHVEREAAVTDLSHWLHQATYWLHASGGAELRVLLPGGARILAVSLDDDPVAVRQPEPDRLAVSLGPGEGLRVLRLRWAFAEGTEPLHRPNLEVPRLKDLPDAPAVWRVNVPAGYRLGRRSEGQGLARSTGPAAPALGRAQAQLKRSALLVERLRASPSEAAREQLVAAQKLFYRECRQAARLLTSPGLTSGKPSLADRLQELRQQNQRLARGAGLEKVRAAAERQPAAGESETSLFALPERGVPACWYGDSFARPPQVTLTALTEERWLEAVGWSELLLLVLAGAWVLSYLPGVVAWLMRLLPEQIALVGWLGTEAFGLSPLGLLLIVTGVCARVVLVGSWAARRLRRAPAEAPTASHPHPA